MSQFSRRQLRPPGGYKQSPIWLLVVGALTLLFFVTPTIGEPLELDLSHLGSVCAFLASDHKCPNRLLSPPRPVAFPPEILLHQDSFADESSCLQVSDVKADTQFHDLRYPDLNGSYNLTYKVINTCPYNIDIHSCIELVRVYDFLYPSPEWFHCETSTTYPHEALSAFGEYSSGHGHVLARKYQAPLYDPSWPYKTAGRPIQGGSGQRLPIAPFGQAGANPYSNQAAPNPYTGQPSSNPYLSK